MSNAVTLFANYWIIASKNIREPDNSNFYRLSTVKSLNTALHCEAVTFRTEARAVLYLRVIYRKINLIITSLW